ncbi:flavin reductase [Pimelobacter simplex]|uniref:flavin reductase n=1 Tax=Nocardioides simplex TaxID=2045 RepID=UPI00214FF7F0|nr:flavin reductase [Pimelobacter simplex]UUW91444.1 flavin reductase [Pimelobacter simplex]UUW95272.1 flavin reductase [Pimelobacter simplex]
MREPHDQRWYREVLGQYPTGVCVVTAAEADGTPVGFVVGSFTSVSLDPPLVAFFPDKSSTTWPRIRRLGHFCVNILSAEQEQLCRRFAVSGGDKFAGVRTQPAPSGAPILEGAVGWIDCDIDSVTEAGDHYVVLGRVAALDIGSPSLPLLFFQGGYGRFAPLSLAAASSHGALPEQLREVDLVRSEMEQVADELGGRCLVTAVVGDEIVVLGSAGSAHAGSRATLVGLRLPFTPPNGGALAAWLDADEIERWLKVLPVAERDAQRRKLDRIRERGYSLGLMNDAQREFATALSRLAVDPAAVESGDLRTLMTRLNYDPEDDASAEARRSVRVIAAPVFGAGGEVRLAFTLYGFSRPHERGGIEAYVDRVCAAARRASAALGAG